MSERYMEAMKQILTYLKSSSKGILFSKHGHLDFLGYTDSDFVGSKMDRKTISRYLTPLRGNLELNGICIITK